MRIPMKVWKQAQPLLRIPSNMEVFKPWRKPRGKVVFIMGATGTGKSRLSIDLAARFPAEIINSDKIQVHKGLGIVTNKVTKEEQCGIPHHLLGTLEPNLEFTTRDFCLMATHAVESILQKDKLPIIVGGSNSFIESLVSDSKYGFNSKYECCFVWVDVSMPVLHSFVSHRVDKMVQDGLVDEVRDAFDPDNTDYSIGIRRAIGVPELDKYFRAEPYLYESDRIKELDVAINEIKDNTCTLANRQREKIYKLKQVKGWDLNRLDATEVFRKTTKDAANEAWEKLVSRPSYDIVGRFLRTHDLESKKNFCTKRLTRNMIPGNQAAIATSI